MTDRIDGIDIIPAEEYFSENGKVEEKTAPLPPPPKFPLEALPEAMSELARDGAKAIQCPEDFLAVAVLGAAAAAIGSSRVARIKSSWLEPSVIFAGIIGPSGDGKSPAEKEATLPISEKQKDLYRSYKAELRKYEQKLREHKVEEKTAAKEGRAADPPPKKPYLQSTFVQDTTPEALVKALHNNPRGLLRIEDELGGMVAAFDQYKSGGKGRERDLWLSIWAAHEIKVDRKSEDGSLYVPMPCVSLMGNIQPKMLFRLLPYGEDHDGFAARILLSYPESKKVDWTEDEISANTRAKYKNLLTGLYELEPNVVVNDFDEEEKEYLPKEVGFSAEAKTRFSEYFNETTAETREPGFDDRLRYPWAKFRGYGARIALVLAMCRVVDGEDLPEEITFEDVENAVKVMDYFKAMARRVYASIYGQRPEDQLAANIVELLKTLP